MAASVSLFVLRVDSVSPQSDNSEYTVYSVLHSRLWVPVMYKRQKFCFTTKLFLNHKRQNKNSCPLSFSRVFTESCCFYRKQGIDAISEQFTTAQGWINSTKGLREITVTLFSQITWNMMIEVNDSKISVWPHVQKGRLKWLFAMASTTTKMRLAYNHIYHQ